MAFFKIFIMAWQHNFGVSRQKYQLFCINIPLPPFIAFKCLTFFLNYNLQMYISYQQYEKRTT